jgi:cobalt-zinc-cadmium efflux system membrane fusion protein
MRNFSGILAALSLAFAANAAFAHGDEDHSQDAKKPTVAMANRVPISGSSEGPQRLADGSLFVPKSVQRQLELRTQPARIAELAAIVELNGTVIPDPQTGGRVQAPFAGSVMPGPKGMPVAGRIVAKGEVLAYLRPVSGAIERGHVRVA